VFAGTTALHKQTMTTKKTKIFMRRCLIISCIPFTISCCLRVKFDDHRSTITNYGYCVFHRGVERGAGIGRGRAVGTGLTVGEAVGVAVTVGVALAGGVAVGVGLAAPQGTTA